ncbi:MAG: hypothetical protein L6R28_03320 [Planctomycetes bacterium]|nr:hypothetical protein [Planctomycetota bacterium]
MPRVSIVLATACATAALSALGATSESGGGGTSTSLVTTVPGKLPPEIAAPDAVRKARAQAEAGKKPPPEGDEVEVALAPETAALRHTDTFRKVVSGNERAKEAWAALKPSERLEALGRIVKYAQADLRRPALAELKAFSAEQDPEGRVTPALVEMAIRDADAKIRDEAVQEIAAKKDDERVPEMLLKGIRQREPEEQRRALRALAALPPARVQRVVIEHWREIWGPGPRAHMVVARQQSYIADYEISGDSYDPIVRSFLIGVVLDVKPLMVYADHYILRILEDAAGARVGKDLGAWNKWWDEEKRRQREAAEAKNAVQNDREKADAAQAAERAVQAEANAEKEKAKE